MAIKNGKLERLITIPTGGWDVTCADDGGSDTITISAGTYYHSTGDSSARDLCEEFENECDTNGTLSQNWTISIASGEGGSGKVTITNDGTVCTVTWVDDDLRDVLGFETDDNLSGSTSYTSSDQARGIWLPDRAKVSPYGDSDDGWHETDARWTESASGHVKTLYSTRKQVTTLSWEHMTFAKTRIAGESTTNESFEKFWEDSILGIPAWAVGAGGPVRYFPDADTDGTSTKYMIVGDLLKSFQPEQLVENSTLYWRIVLDRMVVVP